MRIRILILLMFAVPVFSQSVDGEINFTDSQGRKQGLWKKTFPDSQVLRYEGSFKDDKPTGTFKYYYPGGEIRVILVHKGNGRSSATVLFPDGVKMAAGVYMEEKKDSTWTYYNQFGEKIAVENYIVGKLYGSSLKFHSNGQLLQEKYFENDLENGIFREYFDNGIKSREATYINGSLEGEAAFYHPNGEVRFAGLYYKDAKNGIWKTYDEGGKLIDERRYTKGVPEFRESEIITEDSTKFIRKDVLQMEDFITEDYMAIPPDGKTQKKK